METPLIQGGVPKRSMGERLQGVAQKIKTPSTDYLRFGVHLTLFVLYFIAAIVLISWTGNPQSNAGTKDRPGCFIQQTFRQDFMVNVASNPFYTSSSIFQNAPRSGLEMAYYHYPNRTQAVQEVAMFPNIIYNPVQSAAFLPIVEKPKETMVAGFLVPARPMANDTYYLEDESQTLIYKSMPYSHIENEALRVAALSNVKRPIKVGMQVPNLGRCVSVSC